jgi:hypothetical protein
MTPLLPYQLPWYVVGPLLGLCVVALYAVANRHLGVTQAYLHVVVALRDRPRAEMWRVWFFGGLVVGSLAAALLRGGPSVGFGYGALALVLPVAAIIPVLFAGGLLMGYGARWCGGCTSGHGLTGSSVLSPGSLLATISFMATAVALSFLLHAMTGGSL